MKWLQRYCERFLGATIDDRVYGLVRISFAVAALINLIYLWGYREALFADSGMVRSGADDGRIPLSIFSIIRSPSLIALAFAGAAGMIVCLGLGILPRMAALGVFIWHVSYVGHLTHVAYGGDYVVRIYSFLVLISPLGVVWTWRHWQSKDTRTDGVRSPAFGIYLMRLQLAIIYWDSFLSKVVERPWQDGEAFGYYMLSVYSGWPSLIFADWQWLNQLATYGSLGLELLLPVFLFMPKTRLLAIAVGLLFHFTIFISSSNLFLFSLVMIPPYLAFLSGKNLDCLAGIIQRCRLRKPADIPSG